MRRTLLLLVAAGALAPLAPTASASLYCGRFLVVEQAFGPLCAVKCAYENPPVVDPSRVPPAYLPDASCYYED